MAIYRFGGAGTLPILAQHFRSWPRPLVVLFDSTALILSALNVILLMTYLATLADSAILINNTINSGGRG
jgi:hypothetical protein